MSVCVLPLGFEPLLQETFCRWLRLSAPSDHPLFDFHLLEEVLRGGDEPPSEILKHVLLTDVSHRDGHAIAVLQCNTKYLFKYSANEPSVVGQCPVAAVRH